MISLFATVSLYTTGIALWTFLATTYFTAQLTPDGVLISLPALVLVLAVSYFRGYLHQRAREIANGVRVYASASTREVKPNFETTIASLIFAVAGFVIYPTGVLIYGGGTKVLTEAAPEGPALITLFTSGQYGIPRALTVLVLYLGQASSVVVALSAFTGALTGLTAAHRWTANAAKQSESRIKFETYALQLGTVGFAATMGSAAIAWFLFRHRLTGSVPLTEPWKLGVGYVVICFVVALLGIVLRTLFVAITTIWRRWDPPVPFQNRLAVTRERFRSVSTGTHTTVLASVSFLGAVVSVMVFVESLLWKQLLVDGRFPPALLTDIGIRGYVRPATVVVELVSVTAALGTVCFVAAAYGYTSRLWQRSSIRHALDQVCSHTSSAFSTLVNSYHQVTKSPTMREGIEPGDEPRWFFWLRIGVLLQIVGLPLAFAPGQTYIVPLPPFPDHQVRASPWLLKNSALIAVLGGVLQAISVYLDGRVRDNRSGLVRRYFPAIVLLVPLAPGIWYLLTQD